MFWKVFMACRDMEKCEATRRDIVVETGNKFVYCRPCDLASTQSIREFVQRYNQQHIRLYTMDFSPLLFQGH
jgi:retinol dehydrogenase 13